MPTAPTPRPRRVFVTPALAAGLACLLTLALAFPAVAQRADGYHWVATWAAPLVARPETPQRPAAPPPAEAAAGGFRLIPVLNNDIHLNDQTIRQIVRASTGGEQLRIVVSNIFGTQPLEIRQRRSGAARRRPCACPGHRPHADVQRKRLGQRAAGRRARQRPCRPDGNAPIRPGDRSPSAWRHGHTVAGKLAQPHRPDPLRLEPGRPLGRGGISRDGRNRIRVLSGARRSRGT